MTSPATTNGAENHTPNALTAPSALNALTFPLHGSRLIEASAGTGKTWTIAALYLRLVLGHGGDAAFVRPLMPPDILVMTFTRAATRELSERIRTRLASAARVLRGLQEPDARDPYLVALQDSYPPGPTREQAAWRLAMAAEGMDDAAVQTIDAWCQRMLREHAFHSGALFDETLHTDERTLQAQAARDYWRQQVYPLAPVDLERVLEVWSGVEALVQDAIALEKIELPLTADNESTDTTTGIPTGTGTGISAVFALADAQYALDVAALKQGWQQRAETLADWSEAQIARGKSAWDLAKLRSIPKWLRAIADWARSPDAALLELTPTARDRLCTNAIAALRQPGASEGALTDAVPPAFDEIPQLLAAQQALRSPAIVLREHAARTISTRLATLKRQSRSFGFHDMLVRLDAALHGPNGDALRARILAQYPVAMVDEFQDTSPLQYRIFERLYRPQDNDPATALLLIGDPKQSIYAFRGADIYSYLSARRATTGRHSMLDTNHRSTQVLVDAVNHWFAQAEERLPGGAFGFREEQVNTKQNWQQAVQQNGQQNAQPNAQREADPLPFVPVRARGRTETFVAGGNSVPAMTLVHALQPASAPVQRARFAARCAEQIVGWLNDTQVGFLKPDGAFTRLRPADIAVLVRSGTQAQAMQRALQRRGLASVYLSDKDSVLKSREARDLLWWLQAVAEPLDARRLRTALATATLGLPVRELERLAHDDTALEVRSQQLRALHMVWQTMGVLPMLRQLLHQFDLPARWLREPGGERRLTNLLHLAELLQVASSTLDGEQALVRWLAAQLQQSQAAADEHVVRLESDADLVQIVTVHKSKGLEYPVVCLPFAGSAAHSKRQKHNPVVALSDGEGVRTTHLAVSDAQWEQLETERLREDLRLLYVALTRARHALWLGLAAVGDGKAATTTLHRSAAGHLLGGDTPRTADDWQALLNDLAAHQPSLQLQALPDGPVPTTLLQPRGSEPVLVASPAYAAQFDRRWRTGSFSQLVHGLVSGGAAVELLPTHRAQPADDERLMSGQSDALAPPASFPPAVLPYGVSADLFAEPPAVWHRFARGALVGNFLHEQLEWLSAEDFALTAGSPLAVRLQRRCERAGHATWAQDVSDWLSAAVATVLPPLGVPLTGITTRLPEMEFWLPVEQLDAQKLDALCRKHLLPGLPRPPLPARELHGMLTGFADLVFAHGGRYWVLDYKSNALGADASAYHADALEQAVATHRYDVQAALYLLALHRLLRARLGDTYQPAQHLGGALFFFLRGIDGPQAGVCHLATPLALLDALDAMLAGMSPEVLT